MPRQLKKGAKEYVEAELPKLKNEVMNIEKSARAVRRLNFRLVLGALIAVPVSVGLFALLLFTELAKTEDWVLEYRQWITFGILLAGAAMWTAIVAFPSSGK